MNPKFDLTHRTSTSSSSSFSPFRWSVGAFSGFVTVGGGV